MKEIVEGKLVEPILVIPNSVNMEKRAKVEVEALSAEEFAKKCRAAEVDYEDFAKDYIIIPRKPALCVCEKLEPGKCIPVTFMDGKSYCAKCNKQILPLDTPKAPELPEKVKYESLTLSHVKINQLIDCVDNLRQRVRKMEEGK